MGGGQTQTTNSTQVQQTSPWAPAIPALQQGLTDATKLYEAGVGSQVYGGQRVAGFTPDQSYGIQSIRDQAAGDNSGGIGTSYLQNLLGAGGLSPTTLAGLSMLSGAPTVSAGSALGTAGLDRNGLTQGQGAGLAALSGVQGASTGALQSLAARMGDPNNGVNRTADALMSGARDINTEPALQSLYQRALAPSSAEQNLSSVAAGANLDPTANPLFQKLAQTSADNALQAQKEAFAASGRYGSGSFAGAANKAVNDTQSALFANQYNQERAAQASAAGQIDAARQAGTQLGSSIQGQIGDVQNLNNQTRLSGAGLAQAQDAARAGVLGQVLQGDQFNSTLDLNKATTALGTLGQGAAARLQGATTDVGNDLTAQQANQNLALQQAQGYIGAGQQGIASALQGAGLLPSVDALRYAPANAMLQAGSIQQQQNQADLDSLREYFNDTQTAPWQGLSQYMAFPTSIGSMGGTSVTQGTQQTRTSAPSIGQQLLGGALSIGGLLGRSGSGSLLGSAFGGLGSLLGLSDERAKENVEEVGRLHDGQPVYRFNYRGDEKPQIGLIAQEVAERRPDAVAPMPGLGGLLGVDYGRATDRAAALAPGGKGDDPSGAAPHPATIAEGILGAMLGHAGVAGPGGGKTVMVAVSGDRKPPRKAATAKKAA